MKTILLTTCVLLTSVACADTHSALTARHRESQGVGYNQGYSTLEYYLTSQYSHSEFLLNLRAHLFNDGKGAGNGGVGYRYSLNDDRSRIGANFYYDVRDSKHFIAQQVAGGLEWISKIADVRVNGYLPVGQQSRFSENRFQRFAGNRVVVNQKFSAALPCVEGEVGTSVAKPFYLAAGSYYLFQDTSHSMHVGKALGWKVRFDVDMGHYCSIGTLVTYDHIFKTRYQGYVGLNIPLGPWKSMKDGFKNFEKRRIVRNEIIPIQTKKKNNVSLTQETEFDAIHFIFVNNQAGFDGNGTFERPFNSLKEADMSSKPGDVIYVYPGDGTPRHMNEGIVLKDNQILASAGSPLEMKDLTIPAQTPGTNPTITNVHPNKPMITNPGKSKIDDFYYMDPWEYMRLYDVPVGFDSSSPDSFLTTSTKPSPDSSFGHVHTPPPLPPPPPQPPPPSPPPPYSIDSSWVNVEDITAPPSYADSSLDSSWVNVEDISPTSTPPPAPPPSPATTSQGSGGGWLFNWNYSGDDEK